MKSSLHLSDLSSSSFSPNKSDPSPVQNLRSNYDTCKSQLQDLQERRSKIQQYSTNLKKFETNLNNEKRHNLISRKRTLDQINEEMNSLSTKIIDLQQKEREIKEAKELTEKLLTDQMFIVEKLEDEIRLTSKKSDWAESTFSNDLLNQEDEKPSNQILKLQLEISKLDSSIKIMKEKIFHYQKEMIKISEAMTPTKYQKHQLLDKIDDFNSSYSSSFSSLNLDEEDKKSFMTSTEEKKLLNKKYNIEKVILKIQAKIQKIEDENDTITQKILEKKTVLNEAVLLSISEQTKQFKEALKRKERLYEEKLNAAHSAISKELDIKIEQDQVRSILSDVKKQVSDIKTIIENRYSEIARLEKINAADEDSLAVDQNDVILKSLIRSIQEQRSLNVKLKEDISNINSNELSQEECEELYNQNDKNDINQEKIQIYNNEFSLKNEIELINQDISSLQNQIENALNTPQKVESDDLNTLQKIESDDLNTLQKIDDNTQQTNQLENDENDDSSKKEDSFSIKIRFNNDKINELEKKISKLMKKKEKKISKINELKKQIDDDISQLDLQKTYPIFSKDFFEKFERSISWLSKGVKKQLKIWRSLPIFSIQTIDEWETKILSASSNEAEDLYVKFSALNLRKYINSKL